MIKKKKILGIIPARIGSKGLKFKKIKILNSKPLIYWPFKTLKKCKFIDKIIVNTDSKKIKKIANNLGADVPFLRPKNLANDNSKISDVIILTIKYFKKNLFYDYIILLEPTSPLTNYKDIDKAIQTLEKII